MTEVLEMMRNTPEQRRQRNHEWAEVRKMKKQDKARRAQEKAAQRPKRVPLEVQYKVAKNDEQKALMKDYFDAKQAEEIAKKEQQLVLSKLALYELQHPEVIVKWSDVDEFEKAEKEEVLE